MLAKTRIYHYLVWFLYSILLQRNHGFTPPNLKFIRTRTQTWGPPGQKGGGGGGNKNIKRFLASFDDDSNQEPSSRHELPIMVAGGVAWLSTFISQTKESYAVTSALQSSPVIMAASSTVVVAGQQVQQWKMLLTAALFVIQALGLQTAQLCASVARQGTHWYLAQLKASPLITKSITSGVIGVCGDYCAQWLEYRLRRRKRLSSDGQEQQHMTYNARRGLAILVDSLLISGPLMHWGYNLFEHIIPSGRSLGAIAHVIADSILLDTIFVGTAIVGTGLVEGYKFQKDICPQLQRDYGETLKASWATSATLLPLEFVCFRYLPVTLRTLAMNLTDVLWGGVISFMAHKARQHDDMPAMMLVHAES